MLAFDKEAMARSWAHHEARPAVSIEAHIDTRRLELGRMVAGKVKVYLDQNCWIDLMHASDGGKSEVHVALLEALLKRVNDGKVFCPVSESVLLELAKNSNDESRSATARMVQRLSAGIAIRSMEERVNIEMAFSNNQSVQSSHIRPQDVMWTKASYVLGHPVPNPLHPGIPAATKLVMQKSFFDFLWSMPFSEMADQVGSDPFIANNRAASAESIRSGGLEYAGQIKNFDQAYEAEANGVAWILDDEFIWDEVSRISESVGVEVPILTKEERADLLGKVRRVVGYSIWKRTETAAQYLRGMFVLANLHATVRVDLKNDPKTKFVGNDLFDFDHAAAAVAYCDYFFTEKRLHARLKRPEVALDKVFQCQIAYQPEVALALVEAI